MIWRRTKNIKDVWAVFLGREMFSGHNHFKIITWISVYISFFRKIIVWLQWFQINLDLLSKSSPSIARLHFKYSVSCYFIYLQLILKCHSINAWGRKKKLNEFVYICSLNIKWIYVLYFPVYFFFQCHSIMFRDNLRRIYSKIV